MDIVQVNDNRVFKALRYIKSRFAGNSHESVQIAPFGDDSVPAKGIKGIKIKTSTDAIHVVIGYMNRNNLAKAGEKRLYSVKEDGSEAVSIYLKNDGTLELSNSSGMHIYIKADGTMELGGSSDFLVRFNDLNAGFNKLRDDLNTHIAIFNAHVHNGVLPDPTLAGVTLVPTVQSVVTTAEISKCKIDNIKTP